MRLYVTRANRAGGVRSSLLTHARSLALFAPREVLAPLLPHSSSAHCTLISGGTPGGRLLYEHMVGLLGRAQIASTVWLETAVNQIVQLVASGITAGPISPAAALSSIKRYLDANLDAREPLSSEALCRRFACSRATLYRLFESEGGLVKYIQQRRLQHALMELISPGHQRRIIDIALQNDFASEATFNRAFRRMFGIPPGEARKLARPSSASAELDARREEKALGLQTVRWLKELGRPLRPAVPRAG